MNSDLFEKVIVNKYKAIDKNRNDFMLYRRSDFTQWAKEAYDRGEEFFYCRPVDPTAPYGKYELCEPEYRWFLKSRSGLTEDQYEDMFSHDKALKSVFDKSGIWERDADQFGDRISNAIESIIEDGLEEFTPESVHYIALSIISYLITKHIRY